MSLDRAAGPKRNSDMAGIEDALVASCDGKSRGTLDMSRKAQAGGLVVHVIRVHRA
jgi:hypothetical protein